MTDAALSRAAAPSRHAPLGLAGFVALMAALMALNALAVDIMLPALPAMAAAFGAVDTTAAQPVITAYLLGFGLGQFGVGVLADRYGRRPVLMAGLVVYAIAAIAIALAGDLSTVLALRFLQGLGSAAPRAVTIAIVRDCYGGRQMAKTMSLVMMVFMAAPILAPALGQGMLLVSDWHAIFAVLAVYAVLMLGLIRARLPETLRPEDVRPIRLRTVAEGIGSVFGTRQTAGYMLAAGTFLGAMFGYINSAQQVLVDAYGLGAAFPLVFAVTAAFLALSTFVNALVVERLGMRILSHGAVAAFTATAALMLVLDGLGLLSVWAFVPLMGLCTMLVGLVFSNMNALAMSPQGHMAGIASSITGGVTTVMGAVIGYRIGQGFDGSAAPLAAGYVVCGLATLAIIAWTERGRLFRAGPGH